MLSMLPRDQSTHASTSILKIISYRTNRTFDEHREMLVINSCEIQQPVPLQDIVHTGHYIKIYQEVFHRDRFPKAKNVSHLRELLLT